MSNLGTKIKLFIIYLLYNEMNKYLFIFHHILGESLISYLTYAHLVLVINLNFSQNLIPYILLEQLTIE